MYYFVEKRLIRVKAMVVDDQQSTRFFVASILKNFDSEVLMAENGKKAVDLAEIEEPDIIFMDINMPVMNGVEALKKIKKFSFKTEIILMTAYAKESLLKEAEEYGVYILKKPFPINEIKFLLSNFKNKFCNELLVKQIC